MNRAFFEDWQIGDRIVTPGRTITEADLVLFAGFSGDWHPLHTDREFAKNTAFGDRIAHGLLILAIGNGLFVRANPPTLAAKYPPALLAIEKARFVMPAKIGDTIHMETEVMKSAVLDAERGLLTMRHCIKNQRGEDVLIYTTKVLFGRRQSNGQL